MALRGWVAGGEGDLEGSKKGRFLPRKSLVGRQERERGNFLKISRQEAAAMPFNEAL